MADEAFYSLIADELEHKKTDRILWTRALGEAGGDLDKANAFYIRLRLAELKKAAEPILPPLEAPDRAVVAPNNALLLLRAELARTLSDTRKSSFYTVLKVSPEAPDAEVTAAIAQYEARIEAGVFAASPEFKYAKESLGNPKSREAYDRRVFTNLTAAGAPSARLADSTYDRSAGTDGVVLSLWESRKASVMLGVLALSVVGYFALGFYKEREASAARKKAIDAQVLEASRAADNDATRAGTERVLVNSVLKNTETVIDRSTHLGNRAIDIQQDAEDRRRQELEYRANATHRSLEMQRESQERQLAMQEQRSRDMKRMADERRAEAEKRYWACMNQALDRSSASNANARCAGYR